MQQLRQDFHARIEKTCTENEATSNILQRHNRQAIAHPWKEVDHPELLSTIINIAQASSAMTTWRQKKDRNSAQLDNFGWFASRTDKPWFQTYLLGCLSQTFTKTRWFMWRKETCTDDTSKVVKTRTQPQKEEHWSHVREVLFWWHDVNQWATWRRCCNLPVEWW